jgi:hypothetical protein
MSPEVKCWNDEFWAHAAGGAVADRIKTGSSKPDDGPLHPEYFWTQKRADTAARPSFLKPVAVLSPPSAGIHFETYFQFFVFLPASRFRSPSTFAFS